MRSISDLRCAIVVSDFNTPVTQPLLASALDRLNQSGVQAQNYSVWHVPGAIEIPYVVQKIAKHNNFDVIIALGAVIRGETSHYDVVCNQVSNGCMQVMLQYDIPVILGVLTTENFAQAMARVDGTKCFKGYEVVDAALHMACLQV